MLRILRTRLPKGVSKNDFACSREGLTIRGTEYRPTGNRLPAAIVSHGFSKKYELLALETLDGFLGD